MNSVPRRILRLPDLLLIIMLLLICGILFSYIYSGYQESTAALITVDGAEIRRVSLKSGVQEEIPVDGVYPLVVEVQNERVRVKSADCPDQICVSFGWISRVGSSIVCLPARVSVQIVGEDLADGLTY